MACQYGPCPILLLLLIWISGLYHLPHTNFSSIFRTDFRWRGAPVDHVSLKRMSRNFQKEANTDYLGDLPEWTTDSLFIRSMQTAIPTVGIVQPEKMAQNVPLTPEDIVSYTTSALEAKPTSLNLNVLPELSYTALNFFLDSPKESRL